MTHSISFIFVKFNRQLELIPVFKCTLQLSSQFYLKLLRSTLLFNIWTWWNLNIISHFTHIHTHNTHHSSWLTFSFLLYRSLDSVNFFPAQPLETLIDWMFPRWEILSYKFLENTISSSLSRELIYLEINFFSEPFVFFLSFILHPSNY